MSATVKWKVFVRCIGWGVAIEAPILAWFLSIQDRMHVSMIPGMLFVPHVFSYGLTMLLLRPLHGHISKATENWLGFSLMGVFQVILIGGLLFLAKRRGTPLWHRRADS
jgi:hypothetical protein